MIAVHDVQDVHELALVRVDTLHLNIEHRIRVQLYPVVLFDVAGKPLAAQMLDLHQTLAERLVVHIVVQPAHLLRVAVPRMTAEHLVDKCRQLRICPHEPAPMRDAVRLVVELARRVVIEILERRGFQNACVNLRHAVDTVPADDGEACHVHNAVLNDGERAYLFLVAGVAAAHLLKMAAVDLVDDHIDAREQGTEHVNAPRLKRLRHDRVVRVCDRVARDRPRILPG